MTRTGMMLKSLFLTALLSAFALQADVQALPINIVSDTTTWMVFDTNGNFLGKAQNVCLNQTAPSNCPTGATQYGFAGSGWNATLSSIPGATWIWAPGITGATFPAGNAEFIFQREFYLCAAPRGGTISIAADDFAEVFLNGALVNTSASQSALKTINLPSASLVQGLNIIQVRVKNGPNHPVGCPSGRYQCNPAGMVLGASFDDGLNVLPACTGTNERTFTVGQFETLACPAGQTGTAFRACLCSGLWGATFSTCARTCTGTEGRTFNIGEREMLSCPIGLNGSAFRTCQANGTWSPPNSSTCVPPTTCPGSDGRRISVGVTETLPCPPDQDGSPPLSHTCQSDGSWGQTSGKCVLRQGAMCGSSAAGVTGNCPTGTTCKSRQITPARPPLWCVFVLWLPSECRPERPLNTSDWFCDP